MQVGMVAASKEIIGSIHGQIKGQEWSYSSLYFPQLFIDFRVGHRGAGD